MDKMSFYMRAKLNDLENELIKTKNYKDKKEIKRQITELRRNIKENELKVQRKAVCEIILQHSGFCIDVSKIKDSKLNLKNIT